MASFVFRMVLVDLGVFHFASVKPFTVYLAHVDIVVVAGAKPQPSSFWVMLQSSMGLAGL